jgi:hypothetical protein
VRAGLLQVAADGRIARPGAVHAVGTGLALHDGGDQLHHRQHLALLGVRFRALLQLVHPVAQVADAQATQRPGAGQPGVPDQPVAREEGSAAARELTGRGLLGRLDRR